MLQSRSMVLSFDPFVFCLRTGAWSVLRDGFQPSLQRQWLTPRLEHETIPESKCIHVTFWQPPFALESKPFLAIHRSGFPQVGRAPGPHTYDARLHCNTSKGPRINTQSLRGNLQRIVQLPCSTLLVHAATGFPEEVQAWLVYCKCVDWV